MNPPPNPSSDFSNGPRRGPARPPGGARFFQKRRPFGQRQDGPPPRGPRPGPLPGNPPDQRNPSQRPEVRRPQPQREELADEPGGIPPSQMTPLQLAARIVSRSSIDNPADMVLRQTLFRRRGLSPSDTTWVSRAVFSYFRWERWLASDRPLESRIEDGMRLAARFAADPKAFSNDELVRNTLPEWAAAHMPITPELARAFQREPQLWLRSRPEFSEELANRLRDVQAGPFPDAYQYSGREDLFLDRGFQAGQFEIQDVASQAVGRICAPRAGEVWWDACAGEGGKTLHLSALMGGKSLIWASDRAGWRLDRLRQRAGRAKCFNYRAVHWDGSEHPPTKTRFDGILLDAPCSGLGTWGRNPHSRWTTTVQDVEELAAIQRQLLQNVADSLKPGGRLIYAVCTLSHAETSGVADWFTQERSDFDTLAVVNPFQPDEPPVTQLHLWPQDTSGNGMFIAAWKKL